MRLMDQRDICGLMPEELSAAMVELGQPAYRAGQIFRWIHQKKALSFEEMTDLPIGLRAWLGENFTITSLKLKKRLVSSIDNTVKYLYEFVDGAAVEAVKMEYRHGASLCISTQVGCKMGCTFCASALAGFMRDLTPAEMLRQVYEAERDADGPIGHVVLMGIGEPLDNMDNVLRFLQLLSHSEGRNISLRNVTLSTCGLVDQIDRLAGYGLGLTLAVSLHAPNDDIRRRTMPVSQRWPMDELLAACKRYTKATGRRITYEYALIDGLNDAPGHARELAGKLKGSLCHVNLIPVNPVKEAGYRGSAKDKVHQFAEILSVQGIPVTVRRTLGEDIEAACGQLRRETLGVSQSHI